MGQRRQLIDSNVLVAAAAGDHIHHESSSRYLASVGGERSAISIHSLAEFYNSCTSGKKSGVSPNPPTAVCAVLRSLLAGVEILELTPDQHLDALDRFAALGGAGPRVYDYLIGQVAIVHAIPLIVTWNVRHFQPLFPTLRVATPDTLLQEP